MSHSDFGSFFAFRIRAVEAHVSGDPAPLDRLMPKVGDASLHILRGDSVFGVAEIGARYISDVAVFEAGGKSRFEVLQQLVDDELAFWTGYQIAAVRLSGRGHPIERRIRVTDVFRRVDGAGKLVHRHADVPQALGVGS